MVMAFSGEGSDEEDEGNADDDERRCSEGRERENAISTDEIEVNARLVVSIRP